MLYFISCLFIHSLFCLSDAQLSWIIYAFRYKSYFQLTQKCQPYTTTYFKKELYSLFTLKVHWIPTHWQTLLAICAELPCRSPILQNTGSVRHMRRSWQWRSREGATVQGGQNWRTRKRTVTMKRWLTVPSIARCQLVLSRQANMLFHICGTVPLCHQLPAHSRLLLPVVCRQLLHLRQPL